MPEPLPAAAGDHILRVESYSPAPLVEDIESLSDPARTISDAAILSLLAKYFHAYVHEGSETRSLSLPDLTTLFEQYAHRRTGGPALEGREDLRRRLLDYTFALTMLADLPRTAAIFGQIVRRRLAPASFDGRCLALDIGAGTGVLMLADTLLARRSGFDSIRVVGIERDGRVAARTGALCHALGTGHVVEADAKAEATYQPFTGQRIAFVSNETIPGMNQRLWREDFIKINRVLFACLADELAEAGFFPEGLLAEDQLHKTYFLLVKANRFHQHGEEPDKLLTAYARGLLTGDVVVPLHLLGNDLLDHIPPSRRPLLGRRW